MALARGQPIFRVWPVPAPLAQAAQAALARAGAGRYAHAMTATRDSLREDLRHLGLGPGGVAMVHSSLSALGPVEGGAEAVVDALLDALGPEGTLVMPAFRDEVFLPGRHEKVDARLVAEARAKTPPFNPATTPTTSGAIPEAFRQRDGAHRSAHPFASVAALGPRAWEVVVPHPTAWAEGPESPYERLVKWNARLLLLGVGFNRLTLLHHAESLVPQGRRKTSLVPEAFGCLLSPQMGHDDDTHFPEIERLALAQGIARQGRVGEGRAIIADAAPMVEFARAHLAEVLPG